MVPQARQGGNPAARRIRDAGAMTPEQFILAFRERHRWRCAPGAPITADLEAFARAHAGAAMSADELYELFCATHGLTPKIGPRREAGPGGGHGG